MRTQFWIVSLALLLAGPLASFSQDNYVISYNFQFIPVHEYINSMTLSTENREYYSVFIIAFQNKGNVRLQVNDKYEILTDKKERHTPRFAPFVKKDLEARLKFASENKKVGWLEPGETKYRIAVFDLISQGTEAFNFTIRGLPDANGEPNKVEVVAHYQRVKGQWQMMRSGRQHQKN